MFWFWLGLILFLGLIEGMTINLVSIWFILSGLLALILSFIIDNFVIQFGVFVIVGIILMLTTRKTLEEKLVKKEKTNLDRVIGMKALVTENIEENSIGEVKVYGLKWSAVSDTNHKKGDYVKVLKIDGVKLKVESWEE